MPSHPKKKTVHPEIWAGLLLMLAACALATIASVNSRHANAQLNQSMQIRQAIGELFGEMRDAENGQRGYLLVGEADYLQPYLRVRRQLPDTQAELRSLIANDPIQRKLLDKLDAVVAKKMAVLAHTIELRGANDQASALAAAKAGYDLHLMDQVRQLLMQLDAYETKREAANLQRAHQWQQQLLGVIIATTLLALLLAILVIRREVQQRYEMQFKNAVLKEQMEHQQATEAQLRQAQKMEALGQLTGGIAHDFNNMLAIIVGNLEMAQRRLPLGADTADKFINNALIGASRTAELTKRLLAFSRRQALHPTSIDVNECVQEMFTILSRTLGENITLQLMLGERVWPAFVDQPQLASAILNLAVNSRDAMEGHGQLTIETANAYLDQSYVRQNEGVALGEYVMVSVSDTGHGMSQEVLHKVFEPYFTTKSVGKGTGLGLAQIHGFLAQSKGHTKIYSEVGVGTTVKLYLPRAEKAEPAPVAGRNSLVAALPNTVLVVEDSAEVRVFVTTAVEELGYRALQAENAEAAERVLEAHPEVSILLTDVVMPGSSGVQLADAMTGRFPELRVLLMSGYAPDIVERATQSHKHIHLLAKPFTIRQLAEALHATLNKHP
ncbi:CHASE3 domain-containing protein [Dyella flagellata]|uniref:histidine kinase n=1 Tax=Dyella flagellata TaxID=1867833 RepID=A0ABQ5XH96_9GAMM|nr:CHASE3 domain-containing protein [Dyella flagellata]GLQ89839.1 histidine kinase [Dyella flagellata]